VSAVRYRGDDPQLRIRMPFGPHYGVVSAMRVRPCGRDEPTPPASQAAYPRDL
jgi:hypothetical protein